MSNDEIFAIINFINSLSFSEFEMETDEIKIRIKRDGQNPSSDEIVNGDNLSLPEIAVDVGKDLPRLVAPITGVFYKSPAPDEPAFVEVGDVVQKGDTLCILEAMKMLNEVKSDRSGTIKEIVPRDGEPINESETIFIFQGE